MNKDTGDKDNLSSGDKFNVTKAERDAKRAAQDAGKAAAKEARASRLQRIAAQCGDIARSFARRAETMAQNRADPATASQRKTMRKMLRAASEADAKSDAEFQRVSDAGGEAKDRGTGLTRLKLHQGPVGTLIEKKLIGAEERNAADEISLAFSVICSTVAVRGMAFERVDKSPNPGGRMSMAHSQIVNRYTGWAQHWTRRNNLYGDPMLEIVIAAVIDERPIRTIAADVGFHHTKIEKAVMLGLRDYAARAGAVNRRTGDGWTASAESLFVSTSARLLDAFRRARIEV